MDETFWNRLEPHCRVPAIEEGLAARTADPLWMLARQWQVGEFRGEDAASPISMRVRLQHVPLVSFRNESDGAHSAERLNGGVPLEARVEAQTLPSNRGRFHYAATSGLDFLRRLDTVGLDSLRSVFRKEFPLRLDAEEKLGLPATDSRFVRLLQTRSLDGLQLAATSVEQVTDIATPRNADAVSALWHQWRSAWQQRIDTPGDSGETWTDNRLEHQFSIATKGNKSEHVLTASEYPGGRLDWHSFDLDPKAATHVIDVSETESKIRERTVDTLAVPLSYTGMPASRYWEFEEGSIYFGGIEAGPADIGRILVAEFATVYSDDWYLVPVRFPVSSLARIQTVTVKNTFGEQHVVRSCAAMDAQLTGKKVRNFAFFELDGDPSAAANNTPWLTLLPGLVSTLVSKPIETVNFVRDEAANLAWAIEETIETASGRSLRRRLLASMGSNADHSVDKSDEETGDTDADDAANVDIDGSEITDADAPWHYRLQNPVAPHWIPFIPQRINENRPSVRLVRARLAAWSELRDMRHAGPKGSLLQPNRPFELFEEEIPRGGVQVTRHWQVARGGDGRLHTWMSRRKRPGRGERGSNLAFDRTIRRP